jgi:thiamine biosynthesis lipoprotein
MKRSGIIVLALLLLTSGCSRPKTVQKTESIMGTEVTITVVARTNAEGAAAIDAAMAEVRRFDQMMSLYKDESEITRVNLAAGKNPVKVSPEMIEVVEHASEISKLSGGAFDVTIGPLVVLWQMRLKEGKVPTDEEITNVRSRVNYKDIVIDKKASTLFLRKPNMIMDFGGVAKGYAADKAAEVLRKRGIENGIVALAGDIRVMGHRPDGSPWRIGVQHPREADKTLMVLDLSDKSISTSGDYERFQIVNKKRYHHVIDPRTGKPSTGMESVTVVGDSGAIVDPLTTALFILGTDKGLPIVKKLGCDAIFVDDRGTIVVTDGIKTMQEQPKR